MADIPTLKVVVGGNDGVGKTSLVRRFCERRFEGTEEHIIGVDFKTHLVNLPSGTVKLSIWDLAGDERFETVRAGFYRGALASALIFSLVDYETLKSLARWYHEIRRSLPEQRFLVVGNKADLAEQQDDAHARELARIIHAPYIRSSALTGSGVDELFMSLAGLALEGYKPTVSSASRT